NRRHFFQMAEIEWERSRRHRRPLCLLLLDVDNFKSVNDRYGHVVGDEVLRAIVGLCRSCLRKSDLLGRFGGEEFVALLPETDSGVGAEIAERIRGAVESGGMRGVDVSGRVTVSMGVAGGVAGDRTLDAFLRQADRALYAAKNAGRNRVSEADMTEVSETQ